MRSRSRARRWGRAARSASAHCTRWAALGGAAKSAGWGQSPGIRRRSASVIAPASRVILVDVRGLFGERLGEDVLAAVRERKEVQVARLLVRVQGAVDVDLGR